jgi:hypothetical protein
MTREQFIKRLLEVFGEDTGDVFSKGLENGWLEFEDKLYRDDEINRKNIARIIHLYLLKEKGISDLKDISKAAELCDLYDCRVCANHVAQVYLRDIMSAKELSVNGGFLWFDLNGEDDTSAIEDYLIRAYGITMNAQ